MPFLLNTNALGMCGHGGKVQWVPAPRVMIRGAPAVLAVPPTLIIAGCANPPPPANTGPGVTAIVASGQTMRIKTMGMPLLTEALSTSPAIACATPVSVRSPGQFKVQGQ
jgi:hypothetical protein